MGQMRGQPHAIRHLAAAVLVIGAARAAQVQQLAGDIGHVDVAGVLILHLVEAALAATVAQASHSSRFSVEMGRSQKFTSPI
jgi:site-specific recombinase XerD